MSKSKPVNAVATAFLVLEELARHEEPASLTFISEELDSTKTKIHRHLQTLMALGYVRQLGDGGLYTLTAKLRRVAQGSPISTHVLSAAQIILPQLRDQLGLTVTLGRATSAGVEIIEIARANTLLQITTQPGALFGLEDSAHGKVSLSFGSEMFLKSIDKGITRGLKSELQAVRKQGWAVAPGAILAGINAVAVPLLNDAGELLGSIAALGALQSVPEEPPAELVRALQNAARKITDNVNVTVDVAI